MRALLVATLLFGSIAYADDEPPTTGNEVIEIHDHAPPKVVAKPQHYDRQRVLPYSEKAILTDAWTSAWFLLDIDPHGTVQRIKFLVHPGYDLDAIAQKEAFALSFAPALDDQGNAMPSRVAWRMEWPAHGWIAFLNGGQTTGLPPEEGLPPHPAADAVPCAGSGPWAFDSGYSVFRDCRVPDLARGLEHAAWINRPR